MTPELFLSSVAEHYKSNRPFVVYSRPINNIIKCWLQQDDALHITHNFEEEGFVFAPFKLGDGAIVFPAESCFHYTVEADGFKTSESETVITLYSDHKRQHMELVTEGIKAINSGSLNKVVLSRSQTQTIPSVDIVAMFKRLFNTYKNAMVYCWFHPKVGLWLGATPELLFKVEGRQLTTISLAGTKEYNDDAPVDWTLKETEEQQIVTDYITSSLKPYTNNIKKSDLETARAGQLLHLKTRIIAHLRSNTTLNEIVRTLHPTPAVCGFPKLEAMNFIDTHEGYDRQYYTGFLGELNLKTKLSRNTNNRNVENSAYSAVRIDSNFYVNLRCMQIKVNDALVYVGGGVTKNSIPEKEWEETVAKSKTILKVL